MITNLLNCQILTIRVYSQNPFIQKINYKFTNKEIITMLEDRFPQLMRTTYNCRVLVSASYRARQSLSGKGLTPAIFLSEYYRNNNFNNPLEICYGLKNQKQYKPMPDFVPIDLTQYQHYSQEILGKNIRRNLEKSQVKYQRCSSAEIFKNKATVQSHLNNQNFHWFYQANQTFYYGLSLNRESYRVSSLQQPLGLTMIIEVDSEKGCKQQFQQLQKETTALMKKLYLINIQELKQIKIAVLVLFDGKKGKTIQDAFSYTEILKKDYKVDQNLICRIEINSKQAVDMTIWSMYSMPIFHYPYNLKPSDPVLLLSQDMHDHLRKTLSYHKEQIKQGLQARMDYLIKKYEEVSNLKSRVIGFFKGSSPTGKNYVTEEQQVREIADKYFLVEDYRKAFQAYKFLAKKMENRDKQIQTQIACMIQACIGMGKYHNLKLKDDPFNSIQRHADRILKSYATINKCQLLRYIIFLMYMFHNFRAFHKDFIKKQYYHSLKVVLGDQRNPLGSLAVLVHQQYACLSLLTKNIDYRHYCYELTRVAWKFTALRIYHHALRCLILVHSLYQGSFIVIQKYVLVQLSKVYLEMKNYEQALNYMKAAWKVHIGKNQTTEFDNKHFLTNHIKIVQEIQRVRPELIIKDGLANVAVPILSNINIEVQDEMLDNDDKGGVRWQKIGQSFTDNKDMLSIGFNRNNFAKIFRQFDKVSPEQKSLLYQLKSHSPTPQMLKRNSRTAYIGQPMRVSFQMINPLNNDIDVENVNFKLKNNPQFSLEQDFQLIGEKIRKGPIKSSQRVSFDYTIIPKKEGFLELQKIQWMLMKILSEYQLDLARTDMQNCYYKIDIVQKTGRLNVKLKNPNPFYYQGEMASVEVEFKNEGAENIQTIFMAVGDQSIFGFKYVSIFQNSQFLLCDKKCLKPQESLTGCLNIKIPLLSDRIVSGQFNSNQKLLFLYKTPSGFRCRRLMWSISIHRMVQIKNPICERLSTHLHLMTFGSTDVNCDKGVQLEWMMVRKGYQIVKEEVANLKQISHHYYFLKKGQNFEKQMHPVKFEKRMLKASSSIARQANQSASQTSRNYPPEFIDKIWVSKNKDSVQLDFQLPDKLLKVDSQKNIHVLEEQNIMKEVFDQGSKSTGHIKHNNQHRLEQLQNQQNTIQVCFLWSVNDQSNKKMRMGCIYLPKLEISLDRSLTSPNQQEAVSNSKPMIGSGIFNINAFRSQNESITSLPFNFRISYKNYIQNSFETNPVLQIPVQMKLKNIFYRQKLNVQVYFSQGKDVDASWQGLVQRQVELSQGEEATLDMKFVTMRGGLFNFSESINYIISIKYDDGAVSGGTTLNITHSKYEALFIEIKDTDYQNKKFKRDQRQEQMFKDMFKRNKIQEAPNPTQASSNLILQSNQFAPEEQKKKAINMEDFMNFEFQQVKQQANENIQKKNNSLNIESDLFQQSDNNLVLEITKSETISEDLI